MKGFPKYFLVVALPVFLIAVAAINRSSDTVPQSDVEGRKSVLDFTLEGTFVVPEWLNLAYPFVGERYGGESILQRQETCPSKGVGWLLISSSTGKHGYFPPEKINAINEKLGSHQTSILMVPTGKVGCRYGAEIAFERTKEEIPKASKVLAPWARDGNPNRPNPWGCQSVLLL